MVGVIVHARPAHSEVLPARQTVLILVIAHCSLVSALIEVVVGLINEHVHILQVRVQLALVVHLPVHRVFKAYVVLVGSGGARSTAIRSVGFNAVQSSLENIVQCIVTNDIIPKDAR